MSRNNQISFSILMANFNNSTFIKSAIESVMSQTYKNWELIIVDDNSTDNSNEIISSYLKDNIIKFYQHTKNQGYAGALKTAALNASNEILAILDADDKLHETALEIMAKAYKAYPEYGFIYSNMLECDEDLQNCYRNRWIGPTIPEKTNIFQIKISHLKTFRKDAYLKTSGFNPKFKKAVDKDIIFKLEEVTSFKYIDRPLYYYRWHGKGISQSKSAYLAEFYHYLAKLDAYKRRLNTNLPNFSERQIKFEYYRIVFFNLIHFFIFLYRKLNISEIFEILAKKSWFTKSIKEKFYLLKKLN